MQANIPRVGTWYKDLTAGAVFEVVAVDERHATVETQLLDGALAEYDMDSWDELTTIEIEEPEDWRSAFSLADEDSHFSDETYTPESFQDPLDFMEPEFTNGLIDDF